jgi:glycosyltransferase involved in cell wall biosynthesis
LTVNLLFLSASAVLGGAERSLLDILASLRAARPGWALSLIAPADGPLVSEARALGVDDHVVPFPAALAALGESEAGSGVSGLGRLAMALARGARPTLDYRARLRTAIDGAAPDVVHSNGLKPHLLAAWGGGSRPLVWHLHDYIGRRAVSRHLLRWAASHPRAVIASSNSVAADAERALGGRVKVVPVLNGVDLARFSSAGACIDLDAASGLPAAPSATVRVGLVATFARWKGHLTFLEALARVPAELPIRAYVIGGPVYETEASQFSESELKAHAERLNLTGRVGFTGFISRSDEALRSLDIVVHASTCPEPFGLVIVEGMACARAVIASDTGGAREIFSDGVDAVAHTPGNAQILAARITELARDEAVRQRLGRAGRLTAERRFDRARLATDLVPIYQAAAGN